MIVFVGVKYKVFVDKFDVVYILKRNRDIEEARQVAEIWLRLICYD
jgi:hypothetical protein